MRAVWMMAVVGCAPPAGEGDLDSGVDSGVDSGLPTPTGAEWASCQRLAPSMRARPECATYDVPLRWAEEETDPTVAFTVYRYRSEAPTLRGQVWLLDGGPGGNGVAPGAPAVVDVFLAEGWDVYIPSQRGTSGPDALTCVGPSQGTCHADLVDLWTLEGLAGFTSGEAARDTQLALADADDGRPQILFGTSYGTYLAMRVLQIDDQIDGVILDSSMTLEPDVWRSGVYLDEVVTGLVDQCIADVGCADRFALGVAESVALVSDPEHCPEVDPAAFSRGALIGALLQLGPAMPLALTARLARCAEEDVGVFDELERLFGGGPGFLQFGASAAGVNQNVYANVVAHDFLGPLDAATRQAAEEESAALTFADASAPATFAQLREDWPVVDGFVADPAIPSTVPPVLVLQGGVDIQTPPAWGAIAADDLGATLITLPAQGHAVFGRDTCAQEVVTTFMADPAAGAALDVACLEDLPLPDLVALDPAVDPFLEYVLGVSDIWPTPKAALGN